MFRTEAAHRAGGFSSAFRLAPAAALWASMIRQGSITASIDEPLATVRLRPSRTRRDLALLMLRAKESYRLTTLLRATPGLSLAARQAVLCMGAHSLSRLGRRSHALALYAKSVYMAPWLFPVNPLIWRRIIAHLRRKRTGYFL